MSQIKILINNSKYIRNISSSRSPDPFKKAKTSFSATKKSMLRSSIARLKPRESYLLTENQSFYKYNYSLQDEADNTNVVFFDANSRKFRTRSSNKTQNNKSLINSYSKVSDVNISKNGKYNSNQRKTFSNARNTNFNLNNNRINNEKRGMTTNNIFNKINLIKITEKNIKNPENRAQIIKQLKKEKDELLGKSYSNRKNQLTNNIYNNDKNNNINISNQKSINRNILQNMSNSNNNKRSQANTNVNHMTKSFDRSPNSQIKQKQDYSSNNRLNASYQKSYQKEPYTKSNYNKSNTAKKNNSLEEQNKNQNVETSEKKEERTLILVPGQTIEKKSVVENFENPIEELIENPDGTFSSIIKQTKVTTITENIPIEGNKIKTIEGAPELPMYKQQMTHIYKTITSVSQKPGLFNKINKVLNSNNMNNKTNINNQDNDNIQGIMNNNNIGNNIGDKNNAMNENINKVNIGKNLNKNGNFVDISPKKENKSINENNINLKGLTNDKEEENIGGKDNKNINRNISPLEQEKNIKNLLNNISTGKNPEENIEKLSIILANMNENERKAYLEKLGKEIKNKNLIQKLTKSIENQITKNSINNKNEEYNNYVKGISNSKQFDSGMKSLYSEVVDVKEINPLKFDGLFLEINEYNNEKEKNPFEGPSPYIEFYKERSIKIKEKINRLSMKQVEQNENKEN